MGPPAPKNNAVLGDFSTLGEKLKFLRSTSRKGAKKGLGMSLEQLARATGISYSYLGKLERGDYKDVGMEVLCKLESYFGLNGELIEAVKLEISARITTTEKQSESGKAPKDKPTPS